MRTLILSVSLLVAPAAFAGLETDKAAGNCAAYMTVVGKTHRVTLAFLSADNMARAEGFGYQALEKFKRYAVNNKNLFPIAVAAAIDDCRKIGVDPS
jgi:hypothetical protein